MSDAKPIIVVTVPNQDMLEPGFNEMAEGTIVLTDYIDHDGKVLVGEFVRAWSPDGIKVGISVARKLPYRPYMQGPVKYGRIIDGGTLSSDEEATTEFRAPLDHPLVKHYRRKR